MPALLGAAGTGRVNDVAYSLSPQFAHGELQALSVEVRFSAPRSGATGFGWEEEGWDGKTNFYAYARNLIVSGASAVRPDHVGHWQIKAKPGAALVVRYNIVAGPDTGADPAKYERTAPFIRSRWFSAIGFALFGQPDGSLAEKAAVKWTGAPAGYPVVSNLQHQVGFSEGGTVRGTVEDLLLSTIVGGPDVIVIDDRRRSGLMAGVVAGSVASPTEFGRQILQVTAAERRFWGDDAVLPYAVTATPVPRIPGNRYLSGANFADGFGIWTNANSRPSDIAILIAHEYFHNWQSQALGHSFSGDGQEQREAWFGEGFTDYFAWALALRSGAITPAEFRDQWNDMLEAYASSPVRNTPGSDAAKAFFTDQDAQHLPYQRGALLAARWNARLRDEGRGDLRSILLAQLKAARGAAQTPASLFRRIAARHGLNVTDDLRRYDEQGASIVLAANTFGDCARVVTERRARFDAGYDRSATAAAGNVVKGVEPGSKAYEAGLRNGMKLIERTSGTPGDSAVPYGLSVSDGGKTRSIRFMPEARTMITLQRVILDEPIAPSCTNSLSGIRSMR